MNIAVPTKQVQTGGGYWDNTSHTTSQGITFSGTYSRSTSSTSVGPIYVSLDRGTKSASAGRSYSGRSWGTQPFEFQCGNYVSGGTIDAYTSSPGARVSASGSVSSTGYASGTFTVSTDPDEVARLPWTVTITADYTGLGDTWTGSGSTRVSGYGVASASTSANYASLSYSDGGHEITASVSIPADDYSSSMYTVPISCTVYDGYSSASDSGTLPFSPDRMSFVSGTSPTSGPSLSRYPSVTWREWDTSGSLDGDSVSCRYTFYYDYWTNTYIDPTYTTYANVKFTGHYSNGAVATNVNANYINFNGEVYP